MTKRHAIILIVCGIVGAGLWCCGAWIRMRHLSPIRGSLGLTQDASTQFGFETPVDGQYLISLEMSRVPQNPQAERRLDQLLEMIRSNDYFEWTILHDGQGISTSPLDADGQSGATTTKGIAVFFGHAGEQYVFHATTQKVTADFAAANPTILIELDPLSAKSLGFKADLYKLTGLAMLSGVAVWLCVCSVQLFRSRHAQRKYG